MKKLLIFLCFYSSAYAQNKYTVQNGSGSGSALLSQFDIRSYGADTALADNTTAIQAAINAAHAAGANRGVGTLKGKDGGGVVSIPVGVFKTKKLTSYTNVKIQGQGFTTSVLKAIEADTLLVVHNLNNALANAPFWAFATTIVEDFMFDGDSLATVGIYVDELANFRIGRVIVKDFMSQGLILKNSLIGVVDGCYFYRNPTGIKAFVSTGLNVATNHVVIRDCTINLCKYWAVDWSGGGVVKIDHGDMEGNGSGGDTLTGSVYYHDNIWPGGITLDHCWFEENFGTTVAIMNNNTQTNAYGWGVYNVHSILNCQDLGSSVSGVLRNVYLKGTNQKLGIINSVFGTNSTNTIVSDGSAKINVFGTFINATTMRGGATITTVGN